MGRASRNKRNRKAGKRTTAEILLSARQTLSVARRGAQDVRNSTDAERRMIGVRNVIAFGRSVAHVLENLRHTEDSFNAWYERYRDAPVMQYIVDLRNAMLKEGELPVSVEIRGAELDFATLQRNLPPAPPGAKDFFICDQFGGNGWIVELPDGETEKFYVDLPRVPGLVVENVIHLVGAPPDFHQVPIPEVCDRFMRFLRGMVADAERHFRK
jgi:hypothetical protein